MSWIPKATRSSAPLQRLTATLRAKLPGAGEDQLNVEIGNTLQAFCRETNVWRETIERNLIEGLKTYESSPSWNTSEVHFIIGVVVAERYYAPLGGDAIIDENISYRTYKVAQDYTTIKLYPTPSANEPKGLKAIVALAPKNDSLDIPTSIISHYMETIQDGVLERMYAHKSRPYSDMKASELHRRKFHAGKTRVIRDIRGGNASSSPPWGFPHIAPGNPKRGARTYGW